MVIHEEDPFSGKLLASRRHTLVVLLLVLAFSALGALGARAHGASMQPVTVRRALAYTVALVLDWLILAVVWIGIRLRGVKFCDMVGGRWSKWWQVPRDIGIAGLFLIVSNVVLSRVIEVLKVDPRAAVRGLLPVGPSETVLFLMLAPTAGFCEEIIFRAYMQRQFSTMLRSSAAGVFSQGILFALFHGNQGFRFMVVIAVNGWMLGALALWRRSVRHGMIAHFVEDGAVGLLARSIFT